MFHALFTVSRVMQTTNFCCVLVPSFTGGCVCNELSLSMIEGKRSILLHRRTNSMSKKLWGARQVRIGEISGGEHDGNMHTDACVTGRNATGR